MFPSNQTSYVGHTVKLTCISEMPVTWTFNNKHFDNKRETVDPGTNKHKMIIINAQLYNTGEYTCFGTDSDGLMFMSLATLNVVEGI